MKGPFPDSDEEEMTRTAALQARDWYRGGRAALGSLFRSASPPSSPISPSTPLVDRRARPDSSPSRPGPDRPESEPEPESQPASPSSPSQENTPLSPRTMSDTTNIAAKGGKKAASTDADGIMPVLFATIGNPPINFKKMAAMDEEGRTASSLEHKFRKWRQQGREIAEKYPEHAGPVSNAGSKRGGGPAKKETSGKGKSKQVDVGDEEDDANEEAGGVEVKQENTENGAESEMSPPTIKGKGKAKKAAPTNATKNGENVITPKGSKKRGSEDMTADADNEETPAKKAKGPKKGTARAVKKSAAKDLEEEDGGTVEEANSKGKGKAKAKPKAKAAPKKTAVIEDEVEDEAASRDATNDLQQDEGVFDPELVAGQDEGLTDMKFEEEV